MEKRSVFAALVAVLAAGLPAAASAESSVQLYGIVDVGGVFSSIGSNDSLSSDNYNFSVASGVMSTSRWGIRGSEDLGNGLSAVFTLEGGLSATDGRIGPVRDSTNPARVINNALFGRRSVVGLSSTGFGTLTVGHDYTSGYLAAATTDVMNYGLFGSWLTFAGTYNIPGVPNPGVVVGGLTYRAKNAVFYASPSVADGLIVHAHLGAGEENIVEPRDLGRQWGVSASYESENNGLLGQAYFQSTFVAEPLSSDTAQKYEWGAGLGYKFGMFRVVAGYGQLNPPGDWNRFQAVNLGVGIHVGQGELLAQGIYLDRQVDSGVKAKGTALGLAYVYELSKRTKLYAAAGWTINRDNGSFPVAASDFFVVPSAPGDDPVAFAIGVNHVF